MAEPEGGGGGGGGRWAWVVCFAYALNNLVTPPVVICMGVLFQRALDERDVSRASAALVLGTNHALASLLALRHERWLGAHGPRKVAVAAATITSLGVLLCATADASAVAYVITFGALASPATSTLPAAFHLSLVRHFPRARRRRVAVALVFLAAGLGPIAAPHAMNALGERFGDRDALVLLAAITMNSLVAACLLRPAADDKKAKKPGGGAANGGTAKPRRIASANGTPAAKVAPLVEVELYNDSGEYLSESENDYLDDKCRISTRSFEDDVDREVESNPNALSAAYRWWSVASMEVNLQSSLDIFNVRDGGEVKVMESLPDAKSAEPLPEDGGEVPRDRHRRRRKNLVAANVVGGLSLAVAAEMTFCSCVPFMMRDYGMDTPHIATMMTALFGAEFAFKCTAPMIGEWCQKSVRVMFFMSLWMLVFARSFFLLTTTYETLLVVAVAYGIAKGVNSIYVQMVIPNYQVKGKIYTSHSAQRIATSIFLIVFALIIGFTRDAYSSYRISIFVVNLVTLVTIVLWSIEYILVKFSIL